MSSEIILERGIGELRAAIGELRESNLPGLGKSAEKLEAAIDDLDMATRVLLAMLKSGGMQAALAGATPYLRLFALASGGALLARGAAASGADERAALCRFFAENMAAETSALRQTVIAGGESLEAAANTLFA